MKRRWNRLFRVMRIVALAAAAAGCANNNPFVIDLMPAPDLYKKRSP